MDIVLKAGTEFDLGGATVTLAEDANFSTALANDRQLAEHLHISPGKNFALNEPTLERDFERDGEWFHVSYGLNAAEVLTPIEPPVVDEPVVDETVAPVEADVEEPVAEVDTAEDAEVAEDAPASKNGKAKK